MGGICIAKHAIWVFSFSLSESIAIKSLHVWRLSKRKLLFTAGKYLWETHGKPITPAISSDENLQNLCVPYYSAILDAAILKVFILVNTQFEKYELFFVFSKAQFT